MFLMSEAVLMCTVTLFFLIVGASDICFHFSFVDTGCLTVTLHGIATLHSAVTWWVNCLRCIALAEERPVVRLNDVLHVPSATLIKLYGVLVADGVQGEPDGKCFLIRARKTLPRFVLTPFEKGLNQITRRLFAFR